jgi:hypothetical protein
MFRPLTFEIFCSGVLVHHLFFRGCEVREVPRDGDAEAREGERERETDRQTERKARSVQEYMMLGERRVEEDSMLEDGDVIAQDIFARCQHRGGKEGGKNGGGSASGGGGWLAALEKVLSFGGGSIFFGGVQGGGRGGGGGGVEEVKVHVRCRRSGGRFASGVGQQVKLALGQVLRQRLNWTPTQDRQEATLEVHVVLYDAGYLVETPLLVAARTCTNGGLVNPGLKSAESWALAKTLDIKPGHLVLDPMCGSGALLLEAVLFWPSARYLGLDIAPLQVARARANAEQLQLLHEPQTLAPPAHGGGVGLLDACWLRPGQLLLLEADVGQHAGVPLESGVCDRLMCDLPFGKQYGTLEDNLRLYPSALRYSYTW